MSSPRPAEIPIERVVHSLLTSGILGPEEKREVSRLAKGRRGGARALVEALIRKRWLTPFQGNLLLQGRAKELTVGPYQLLERLGEGGMGQVFKGRHQKLGRLVALKVIRKDLLADTRTIKRFEREIQVVSQLSHPNVVLAYDAGQADGSLYLAMEYVQGIDLGQLLKERGPLPVAEACVYMRQAAVGLQHAHEHGLVHRDIKPSNLLRADLDGVIKLLDLGLARLQGDGEPVSLDTSPAPAPVRPGATMLTQANRYLGTPDFMPPEQARDPTGVDIRADLYSLGCTFYYLLTGHLPFAGGLPLEKMIRHQMEEPVPIERFRSDVPAGVAAVVRKLMAKQPEARYQTPAELAEALTGFTGAALVLPVAEVAAPAPAPRRAMPSRLRWVALGIVPLLVLAGVFFWPRHPHLALPVQASTAPAEPDTTELTNSIGMPFVHVSEGQFQMGSPATEAYRGKNEGPVHEVQITQPFYLGSWEVTQGEYAQVMGTNPAHFGSKVGGSLRHPVERVSWTEAVEFCRRLSELPVEHHVGRHYRLPTEAEWEYAYRAGSTQPFSGKSRLAPFDANFDGRHPYGRVDTAKAAPTQTTKVGLYPANGWGLYDMEGNVREWCADHYAATYPKDPAADPTGPAEGDERVVRGGGWDRPGKECRAASRSGAAPDERLPNLGFRVVMFHQHAAH